MQLRDRVLALDVRPRKFGFVVFEGPTRLLDWGVRNYRVQGNRQQSIVASRTDAILGLYAPSAVVMRHRNSLSTNAGKAIDLVTRAIIRQVRQRDTAIRIVSTRTVRHFFARHGCTRKYEIATTLAKRFPDLHWKLPPKRKLWQSEDYRMSIFDAAAVGVAYLAANGYRESFEHLVRPEPNLKLSESFRRPLFGE